jgi:HK97 family phage major capsid protein
MAELATEIKAALEQSDEKLAVKFSEYEKSLQANGETSNKLAADLKAMADDNAKLDKELKALNDEILDIRQKGTKGEQQGESKSIGQQFVEDSGFKNFLSGGSTRFRKEFKNTILGEGGSPQNPVDTLVPYQHMAGIVPGAFRDLRLMDVIPQGTVASNTIHYSRELAWTNNAAETAEGAQKPESSLTFEDVNVPVRTIAHTIKVSKQVMDDAPQLKSYIDRRMRYGVNYRVENQVINGNGTSPNISGLLDSGNFTSLAALSGENDLDFANRMKYSVIGAEYMADYYLINPADWGAIERVKVSSSDDRYVGAGGAINYINGGLQATLWGLPVIKSNTVPQGTLVALSTDSVMFWSRQGTTVEIFDQNEDDVEKNLLTIRAEMRGAFSVFRPAAVYAGTLPVAGA